jgi:hypothetical protein
MLLENPFRHRPDPGRSTFAGVLTIGHTLSCHGRAPSGDDVRLRIPRFRHGGFVGGEGVAKGDLVVVQVEVSLRLEVYFNVGSTTRNFCRM